LPEEFLRARK